jgi:hypothetical protein
MNIRNAKLLEERYASHPMRDDLKSALEAAERFADKAASIRQDGNLSHEGRNNATKAALRSVLRDVRDSGAQVLEMKARLNAIQASIAMPKFDKTDVAGALARQEIRQALRGMSLGDRAGLLFGEGADPRWIDAVLEAPALLSGTPPELYEQAKGQRIEGLFAREIADGEDLNQQIEEAEAALQIARQDVARAANLPEHEVNKLVDEVNSKRDAPWLRREKDLSGNEVIIVVPIKGGAARPATEQEQRDGRYFDSLQEFNAARAA